jgi:hypothetical protein
MSDRVPDAAAALCLSSARSAHVTAATPPKPGPAGPRSVEGAQSRSRVVFEGVQGSGGGVDGAV